MENNCSLSIKEEEMKKFIAKSLSSSLNVEGKKCRCGTADDNVLQACMSRLLGNSWLVATLGLEKLGP